jgi:hypothetical protein
MRRNRKIHFNARVAEDMMTSVMISTLDSQLSGDVGQVAYAPIAGIVAHRFDQFRAPVHP